MKKLLAILMIAILMFSFAACTADEPGDVQDQPEQNETAEPGDSEENEEASAVEMPEFSIEIVGAEKDTFTKADAADFEIVEFDALKTSKSGESKEQHFKGMRLKDMLDYAGAADYTSVKVEAPDGYTQEYTKEMVEANTILCYERDGELLGNSGPIMIVLKEQTSNFWMKNFNKITINQ